MSTDISIDIETLWDGPHASICQIGAAFRRGRREDEAIETFFRVVDDPSGVIRPATVRWHMESDGVGIGPAEDAVPLEVALSDLAAYLTPVRVNVDGKGLVWAHGGFDLNRLEEAYIRAKGHGGRPPWSYRNRRDLRTLYDLAGGRPKNIERKGTRHLAVDDAVYQLREVEVCRARITSTVEEFGQP